MDVMRWGFLFHWQAPGHYRRFDLEGNGALDFSSFDDGKRAREPGNWKGLSYASNRWYSLKVEARGDAVSAYLNGVLQFKKTDAQFAHGRICLFTDLAAARFRRIKVSDPQGKVLFEGLPQLPPDRDNMSPKDNIGNSSHSLTAGVEGGSKRRRGGKCRGGLIWRRT